MNVLKLGDRGSLVELLQTALTRAGYAPGAADGVFGTRTRGAVIAFQGDRGLTADGIAGPMTHRALEPWYTGFVSHTVRGGDTLWELARRYGSTVRAIETANPGLDPFALRIGSRVTVPLGFPLAANIRFSSDAVAFIVRGLTARYPFLRSGELGRSEMGKPLYWLAFGSGSRRVFYNAEHHANEWITAPVLLRFMEELSEAYATEGRYFGYPAADIGETATIWIAPAVNPDGMDLVTGALQSGPWYEGAAYLARNYPAIPFPDGWKANIKGVDLNLQYPAGWDQAREIKFAQGYTVPGPRDYVGTAALAAPESLSMYRFTRSLNPALTLSYHTQGQTIYWKYLNIEPPGAKELAQRFAAVSGYVVEDVPYGSGFAGYKDWFIQDYNRPGYTIEAGKGENPLPISQLDQIYADNRGILTLAALG
jgi:g-D-glutamyl-meso-diaminopimelate peptidase